MIYRTGFSKIYKMWIFLLAFLFLFAPHSVPLINKLIFIIFIPLILHYVFLSKDVSLPFPSRLSSVNIKLLFSLIILQFFLAEYASSYYTGSGIVESLYNLLTGNSNYAKYQDHFRENELSTLSLSKIPAILSVAAIKGIFLFSLSSFALTSNLQKKDYFLFTSAIPLLLFSLSRGTFFEFFEVFLYFFYIHSLISRKPYSLLRIENIKSQINRIAVAVVLLFLFAFNASQRYGDTTAFYQASCATDTFCFSPYTNAFNIEYPLYFLSSYFSTSLFFFTEYIKLILNGELLYSLIPLVSTSYFSPHNQGLFKNLCTNYVDCGVTWTAEIFALVSTLGFFLFILTFSILLRFFFKLERFFLLKLNVYSVPLCYMILLYIVSIPVGSFFTVSSSNIICSMAFIFLWKFSKKI